MISCRENKQESTHFKAFFFFFTFKRRTNNRRAESDSSQRNVKDNAYHLIFISPCHVFISLISLLHFSRVRLFSCPWEVNTMKDFHRNRDAAQGFSPDILFLPCIFPHFLQTAGPFGLLLSLCLPPFTMNLQERPQTLVGRSPVRSHTPSPSADLCE